MSLLILGMVSILAGQSIMPQINSTQNLPGAIEELNNDTIITIEGKRFISDRNATQIDAIPLLWDRTDKVYEKGVLNTHYESYDNDDPILRPSVDYNTLWEKPSAGEGKYGPLTTNITRTREHRHSSDTAHYYIMGPQGFLGWPYVNGGLTTPTGSDQLYVSWWYKPKYDPTTWINFTATDTVGEFRKGDKFSLSGTKVPISGEVIHVEGNAISATLSAEPGYENYAKYYAGRPSVGLLIEKDIEFSGGESASAIFNTPYINYGSNKFIRVWDNPNGQELRFSWTNHQFYIGGTTYVNKQWPGVINEWNHMELLMDFSSNKIEGRVNGALVYNIELDGISVARSQTASPTIGLIGFDGKNQYYQESDFGDIYFNNKLNRVLIADKAHWSEIDSSGAHTELQYPIEWQDDFIKFKLYKGSFKASDKLYLYIFNEKGVPNNQGYLL